MANVARSMSLAQFATHSGLYTRAEIATDLYTQGLVLVDKPTLLGFWHVIADETTWDHANSKGRVTTIRDPLYRYLHKMISTSITARNKSRVWCTSGDLFFLYCLLYKRPCALAHGLAQYFASSHHRQERGVLFGGSYVTVLALSLGYHPETDPLVGPTIQPKRMGMNTISGMQITKRFPVGRRFKGPNGDIFEPAQLPAQFELKYPPHDPEVPQHEPVVIIPELPHPRGPPRAPQFPRHVGPGPAPSYTKFQRLRRDVDRLNYVMEWVVEELRECRQRDGLAPRHFVLAAEWHQEQQP